MKRFLIIAFLVLGLTIFAASGAGTSAASFLNIGVGARTEALGGAFIGLANDYNAIIYNPAGLAFMEKSTVAFTHLNWIADTQINMANAVYGMKGIGVFGLVWENLNYGEIQGMDSTGTETNVFTPTDSFFGLSYGRKLNDNLSVGLTLKYIMSSIDTYKASAFGFDLGGLYKMTVAERPLGIGLSVRNVGSKMTYDTEGDPIPMYFGLGASYGVLVSDTNNIMALFDMGKASDTDFRFNVGIEYGFKDYLSIRLGYKAGGYDVEGFAGGLGAGYTLSNGMRLQLDYSYGSTITEFKDIHRISFSFSF